MVVERGGIGGGPGSAGGVKSIAPAKINALTCRPLMVAPLPMARPER
jgi:hypothetical protein